MMHETKGRYEAEVVRVISDAADLPHAPRNQETLKEAAYERLTEVLNRLQKIQEQCSATEWPKAMYGELYRLHKSVVENNGAGLPPLMVDFVENYIPRVLPMVRKQLAAPEPSQESRELQVATIASGMILDISEMIEADMRLTRYTPEVLTIPLERLSSLSDNLLVREDEILVRDSMNTMHPFPLPATDDLFHKGGFPRVILKILANATQRSIDAELPPNDIDVVTIKENHAAIMEAKAFGVDPQGIEEVRRLELSTLLGSRDISINSCLIGRDALYCTREAWDSACSGKIKVLLGEARSLFGTEWFVHESVIMLKNRGMMRLMKFLAEEKASEFDFIPRNRQVDLGIYWLVLARKFQGKDDAPLPLAKLYEIGKEMGQVQEGENNIFDVLERVHRQYPFFGLSDLEQTEFEVAKWKAGKLLRQIDKAFRMAIGRKNNWGYSSSPGDDIPTAIRMTDTMRESAEAFVKQSKEGKEFPTLWKAFLLRCETRQKIYEETKPSQGLFI